MKTFAILALVALVAVCAVLSGSAQQAKEKELFQQYLEKFGPAGPEHKLLEPLIGTWQASCKMWIEPGGKPLVSDGTLVRKPILDGRFLQEQFDGKMLDKPFHGMGTMGYDRAKQKFVTTWIDSMSTVLHVHYGTYDSSSRTWTFRHE